MKNLIQAVGQFVKAKWLLVPEVTRKRIAYEIHSAGNTFLTGFALQLLIDLQAHNFVISLSTAAVVSLGGSALRAGLKPLTAQAVIWLKARLSKNAGEV